MPIAWPRSPDRTPPIYLRTRGLKEPRQRRASSRLRRMGGGTRRTEPKPLVKLRPASRPRNVTNRNRDGLLLADQDHEPLAAGNAGVEEISLQHGIVLGQDRDHHGGILRPLALVDSDGISGDQGVKLTEAIGHRPPVEACHEFARLGIDVDDIADVAVIDFLVVVILDLYDL